MFGNFGAWTVLAKIGFLGISCLIVMLCYSYFGLLISIQDVSGSGNGSSSTIMEFMVFIIFFGSYLLNVKFLCFSANDWQCWLACPERENICREKQKNGRCLQGSPKHTQKSISGYKFLVWYTTPPGHMHACQGRKLIVCTFEHERKWRWDSI